MTPDQNSANDRDLKWRQYELLVNFTKHGLELALKASVFYFAVTGAMRSFYASQPDPTKLVLRMSLLLPLVMGVCFMLVSAAHAFSTRKARAASRSRRRTPRPSRSAARRP